jgi:hypothetical protein
MYNRERGRRSAQPGKYYTSLTAGKEQDVVVYSKGSGMGCTTGKELNVVYSREK